MTEHEMVGWHHRLDGHEFEQTLGDGEGLGNLACCSPWGRKESDMTEQLRNNNILLRSTTVQSQFFFFQSNYESKGWIWVFPFLL